MAELNPRCHENIRAGRILTSHGAHSPSSSSRTGLIQMRLRPTFAVLNMIEDLRPIFDGFAARLAPQGWAIVSLLNPLSWRKVSTVWLRSARDITLSEHTFRLFRACLSTNDCLGSVERWPYYAFERWRTWRHQQRSPHNFRMTVPDLHALFVFYACPRPVVLVTVEHEGRRNVLPMDLTDRFALVLAGPPHDESSGRADATLDTDVAGERSAPVHACRLRAGPASSEAVHQPG